MIYTKHTKRAIRLCYAALKNKLSREGMPVLLDWFTIAEHMPDEQTTIVALLHGAVESGVFDLEFIIRQGFSQDTVRALEILLLHKEMPYQEYLEQVKTCPCPAAWVVKHAELCHKGTPGRLLSSAQNSRNLDRYWSARRDLEELFAVPYCFRSDEVLTQERILRNRVYQDFIRGCLVGGAVGDALGYAISAQNKDEKLTFSANTQMCLFTATGILFAWTHFSTFGFNCTEGDCIYSAYLNWLETQREGMKRSNKTSWLLNIPEFWKRRSPDEMCISALTGSQCGREETVSENKSWGCVTRIAPIVLYHKNADSKIDHIKSEMKLSAFSASLTHSHKLALLTSALLAHILSRTIYGGSTTGDHLNAFLIEGKKFLFELFGNSEQLTELYGIVDRAITLAANQDSDVVNIEKLGVGWDAHEALAIAIYCCLRHPLDFDSAVSASVNHKGNIAATGCLTGQIMGAKLGYSRISNCVGNLERLDVVLEVADDLCDEDQLRRNGEYDDPKWRSKYVTCDYTKNMAEDRIFCHVTKERAI